MTALVPKGTGSVVLADADGVGTVTVTSFAADGKRLERGDGRGQARHRRLRRPARRRPPWSACPPARTSVHAAALVTDQREGAAVVPFRELVTKALVPDVRPGLP